MSRLLGLLAALLVACGAHAADPWQATTQKLEAYFDSLEAQHFANGVIAIAENGEVHYRRAVGQAWMGATPSATETTTLYKVGDVSNLFSAILAMQLVEGASITLDSPVAEFFPDLPNALQVTYRDLLQNRSGLASFMDAPDYDDWRRVPHTRDEILERITRAGARFAPRERVELSRSNYLLMGYVLEKVREKPYGDVLTRQIAAKLGLARTEFGLTAKPANRMAMSYRFTPDGWRPVEQTDATLLGGTGGVVTNAEDLVRVIGALFGGRLVSATSLATMRGQDGAPGIGLSAYEAAGRTGFGAGGALEGYRACVYWFPERSIAIAYTGNAQLLPVSEIVEEALTAVFERRYQPRAYAPVKLTTDQLAAYAGAWNLDAADRANSSLQQVGVPDLPRALVLTAGATGLTTTLQGREVALVAFGDDEFYAPTTGTFLRIHARMNKLVLRQGDYSYDFKRAG
jgi:D-alanyl-D-alanine carboxypeptidase